MVQLSCPDTARWRALLSDSAPDAAELESHLAGCSRCRELLDDLAVGSSGWLRDAGRLASDTDRDPEMTKTLHRLRDALADDHGGPPVPLDFLTPSDQPGVLGTLGRYQVLDVIGRGAMGIVLKALDPDLLRPVAIKVLAPYLAPSGTARERFKREARAAAAVSHDHIVTIHAVEEANGLPYLVMEYVTGVSLQGRLDRDGPLAPRDIARIGMQAAQGLAAAHAQGLVHRDVKPANILLENGVERVKLTDFGLARAADDARITQSGVAAGTPLYMSPEQAHGDAVDARSDLFSLGSVLYTLATGFPPFRAGSAMGVLHRIINDPPRRIRETIPDFPPALEAIVMQLLEKNPARRFPSAAEVANRLTEFLATAPDRPRPRRGWLVAIGLALAAALLVTGVVLTFRTAKGTLVVEVDDPAVKVALDGEELTITGAGAQEVRYKIGTYRVTAQKDGKPAKVSQDVVTITRDGKPMVKVTAEPAPILPPTVAGPVEPRKGPLPDGGPPPVSPPAVPRTQMDPEWEAKLDPLMKQFQDLTRRLAGTPAGPLMLLPGPVSDPDKTVASVKEADRETVKRLLTLRDQFALLIPRAQAMAVQLHELTDAKAAKARASARQGLEEMYTGLVGQLRDMEKIAAELGAKPYQPNAAPARPPAASRNEWEERLKKLVSEATAVADRLVKTAPGRVLLIGPPDTDYDKATAGLDKDDAFRAKRLLALRDQFRLLVPEAQKGIGRWEKARHEVQVTDLEAARIELADAERDLRAAEDGMTRILADLKKLADEIDAAPSPDADFKKVMAEYEALVLRLAKHRIGRILTVVASAWNEETLVARGFDPAERQMAVKLLNLRDEIRTQAEKGAGAVTARRQHKEELAARFTGPGNEQIRANLTETIHENERDIKVRTETIRGLLVELNKLADELDPPAKPAAPEADLRKVMTEYDAIVLRVAKHPVGRVLVVYGDHWTEGALERRGLDQTDVARAMSLLRFRDEIQSQLRRAEDARDTAAKNRERLSRETNPDERARLEESIRKGETDVKVRTEAIRGLLEDMKKLADVIDPPAKKAGPAKGPGQ